MAQTWYVCGRHYINAINRKIYEKITPKTQKLVEIITGTCNICGRIKSQNFTK